MAKRLRPFLAGAAVLAVVMAGIYTVVCGYPS